MAIQSMDVCFLPSQPEFVYLISIFSSSQIKYSAFRRLMLFEEANVDNLPILRATVPHNITESWSKIHHCYRSGDYAGHRQQKDRNLAEHFRSCQTRRTECKCRNENCSCKSFLSKFTTFL